MRPALNLQTIESAAKALSGRIVSTPTLTMNSSRFTETLPQGATVHMKLELFQQAGSFKARGVILAIDALDEAARTAGVTAVSAGNHALAVSWGAMSAGLSAKVVMPKTADPSRVEGCRAMGAEVVLMDDVKAAFTEVQRLVDEERRTMLHPFESPYMTLGAATCGLEFARAHSDLQIAVIPVGGGGLISGMAAAIRLALPGCEIFGVEPYGADSMYRSFEEGEAIHLDQVNTIADSLGAPMALPESFALTQQNVSKMIRIEDNEMRRAMRLLFDGAKLVAEPACAATTAAICGPLKQYCEGKTVGIIACGSNISLNRYQSILDS